MDTNVQTALIGIDWGTTRLRGFRIDRGGVIIDRRESDLGISNIEDRHFDRALHTLVADWQPAHARLPILMCGMIGSRQGWREIPYRACPASLGLLAQSLSSVETSCGPAHIVGGLASIDAHGDHDVMRGEETQIFGMPEGGRQLVVAPGTHCKWAIVEGGRIERFRTCMTGEIYHLLRRHSTLGWLLAEPEDAVETEAFLAGVRRALDDHDLLALLFAVRTKGLFGQMQPAALSSYLSGLLIGSEVAGGLRHQATLPVSIIASPGLAQLYALALSAGGCSDVALVEADTATACGLWKLWQLVPPEIRQ